MVSILENPSEGIKSILTNLKLFIERKISVYNVSLIGRNPIDVINFGKVIRRVLLIPQTIDDMKGGDIKSDNVSPIDYKNPSIQAKLPEVLIMITYLLEMVDMNIHTNFDMKTEDMDKSTMNIYRSLFYGFIFYIQHMIELIIFNKSRKFTIVDMEISATFYKVMCDYRNHVHDLQGATKGDTSVLTEFLQVLLRFLGTMENIVNSATLQRLKEKSDNPFELMLDLNGILTEISDIKPETTENKYQKCNSHYHILREYSELLNNIYLIKKELDNFIAPINPKTAIVSTYEDFVSQNKQIFENNISIPSNMPTIYEKSVCDIIETTFNSFDEENVINVLTRMINFKEDLRGAVRVFVRVKPQVTAKHIPLEKIKNNMNVMFPMPPAADITSIDVTYPMSKSNASRETDELNKEGNKYITYASSSFGPFYNIFKPVENNQDIFDKMKTLFDQVLNGYHVALFGYGYSGSGKTYTLINSSSNPTQQGVLLQAINYYIKEKGETLPIRIHQVYELYLNSFSNLNMSPVLSGQTLTYTSEYISKFNSETKLAKKMEYFADVLKDINDMRILTGRIKKTINNPESSRSHLFITLKIGTGYVTVCDMGGRENPMDIYENTTITIPDIDGKGTTKTVKLNEIFTSKYLTTFINYNMKIDINKVQKSILKDFMIKKQPFLFKQEKNKKAVQQVLDTLMICFEGFYINETVNHLTWYFNKLNGINKSVERHKGDLTNYNIQNCFVDPSYSDSIRMVKTLDDLRKLSESPDTKPTKFVMMSCVRQDNDIKFIEFSKSTLTFAEGITSTIGTS